MGHFFQTGHCQRRELPALVTAMTDAVFDISSLSVAAGSQRILDAISFGIPGGGVFGIIGPSGAGKSTLLKCLNRMTDLEPGLRVSGDVSFRGESIYAARVNADDLRTRIGFLFQQPVVFPRDIRTNVLFGVRHLGTVPRRRWAETAERALREAALWDEVKDRLKTPALKLSVGQQQRLCLARILATAPEVILMDEPTSALDPGSTEAIETLILTLKQRHTIVMVTHNLPQAERVCGRLAAIGLDDGVGRVLCHGTTADVLRTAARAAVAA
jgi:phosphate transport system ATP-binding protein